MVLMLWLYVIHVCIIVCDGDVVGGDHKDDDDYDDEGEDEDQNTSEMIMLKMKIRIHGEGGEKRIYFIIS